MSTIRTFFPRPIGKPVLHVQEQLPNGTNGGSNTTGANHRRLTTIVKNQIDGASLEGGFISLPKGKYYISACGVLFYIGFYKTTLQDSAGNILLNGEGGWLTNLGSPSADSDNQLCKVEGELTLTAPTRVKLVQDTQGVVPTYGLGNQGDQTPGLPEQYSDVVIWRLDGNKDLSNTPDVTGLVVTNNVATPLTHIDVSAGSCWDATDSIELTLAAPVSLTLPGDVVANTQYAVFLTNDGTVQFDKNFFGKTLLAGAVTHLRFIGFVTTEYDSTNIMQFSMTGDVLEYDGAGLYLWEHFAAQGTYKKQWNTLIPVTHMEDLYYSCKPVPGFPVNVWASIDNGDSLHAGMSFPLGNTIFPDPPIAYPENYVYLSGHDNHHVYIYAKKFTLNRSNRI